MEKLTTCYYCRDCDSIINLLPDGSPDERDCKCDGDCRSWQPMTDNELYHYHQIQGDCECDFCERYNEYLQEMKMA